MQSIRISAKLKPFFQKFPARFYFPSTNLFFQFLENKILIGNISLDLDLKIPFTSPQIWIDLEKKQIVFRFFIKKKLYQLLFSTDQQQINLKLDRGPQEGLFYVLEKEKNKLLKGETKKISTHFKNFVFSKEKISFGSYKEQNMEKVFQRMDPKEIYPLWFSLGRFKGCIKKNDCSLNTELFFEIFNGKLPCELLSDGANKIREGLFFQKNLKLYFLQKLPENLDAGRVKNFIAEGVGLLSFEWRKRKLRRVELRSITDSNVLLILPGVKQFRLRASKKAQGLYQKVEQSICLEKDQTYFFDCFI